MKGKNLYKGSNWTNNYQPSGGRLSMKIKVTNKNGGLITTIRIFTTDKVKYIKWGDKILIDDEVSFDSNRILIEHLLVYLGANAPKSYSFDAAILAFKENFGFYVNIRIENFDMPTHKDIRYSKFF